MFSFFRGSVTGITLGSTIVQAVRAQIKNSALTMQDHAEHAVAKNDQTATPEKRSSPAHSWKRAVILINPECVYTQLFTLPASSKSSLTASMNDVVSRTVPEEFSELIVRSKVLTESKEQVTVGIAAIRKDVLQERREAVLKLRFNPIVFSTAPCAIAAVDVTVKPLSFLLATESLEQTIVTLFHHGWPIDEVLLPKEKSTIELITKAGMEIVNEYSEQGITVDTMFLAGTWVTTPQPESASLSLKHVFPDFKDRTKLATACASVVSPSDLSVNF